MFATALVRGRPALARPRRRRAPVGAALQTPPYNLVLARPSSPQALAALVEAVTDEELPGVVGSVPEVEEFAEAVVEPHGPQRAHEHAAGRLRARSRRTRRARCPGRRASRRPTTASSPFAGGSTSPRRRCTREGRATSRAEAEDRLTGSRRPTAGILLWEDGGEPVSLAGWGGRTPNGIRIGPVYTPPTLRGRGYATALTAELSQRLLDGRVFTGGRRFCFLYTDLANPTSNAIYERIGYRRVAESAEIVFG